MKCEGTELRNDQADDDAHIRDLIEQLLFTSPGERVNRPTFGIARPADKA